MRSRVALTSAVAVMLVLGACSAPPKQQSTPESSPVTDIPAGFESYYTQDIEWEECGPRFECATVTAPMDWADPESAAIELAIKRLPAQGDKIGSMFMNPGGPGGSGNTAIEFVADGISPEVLDQYDLVSWDPRGVQISQSIVCLDDDAKTKYLALDYSWDEAGIAALTEANTQWAKACAQNSGELLGYVDTQSAARDLDMLRSIVGDKKLTYLGYSYGTQLGATYAGLFPQNTGRLVLDGAVDTTKSSDEAAEMQAVGFENALRAYVQDCLGGAGCPLSGSVDEGLNQITAFLDAVYRRPLTTADESRLLTQTLAFTGIAVVMYDDGNWPYLTQALDEAMNAGTGTQLLALADYYSDREPDGSFSTNSSEAFRAVNCLDARQDDDPAFMMAQAERLREIAPTVAKFFSFGGASCAGWEYPVVEQEFDLHAKGAAPIVVIGTTNDPATPYVNAEVLAKTLESGVLLTWEGEGHTAYGRSNSCLEDAVDEFFLEGTVPQDGLVC